MKTYKIIDDSGVDYNFLAGFGYPKTPWIGQIVQGNESFIMDCIIVNKPFGISGTYTADKSHFQEIEG